MKKYFRQRQQWTRTRWGVNFVALWACDCWVDFLVRRQRQACTHSPTSRRHQENQGSHGIKASRQCTQRAPNYMVSSPSSVAFGDSVSNLTGRAEGNQLLFAPFLLLAQQHRYRFFDSSEISEKMPSWWPIRSRKPNKESSESQPRSPQSNPRSPAFKSPTKKDVPRKNRLRDPLRKSKFSGVDLSPSALSEFYSDGPSERVGLPLPRPSVSSTHSVANDNGSVSISSVSSLGSMDDHAPFDIQRWGPNMGSSHWLVLCTDICYFLGFMLLRDLIKLEAFVRMSRL